MKHNKSTQSSSLRIEALSLLQVKWCRFRLNLDRDTHVHCLSILFSHFLSYFRIFRVEALLNRGQTPRAREPVCRRWFLRSQRRALRHFGGSCRPAGVASFFLPQVVATRRVCCFGLSSVLPFKFCSSCASSRGSPFIASLIYMQMRRRLQTSRRSWTFQSRQSRQSRRWPPGSASGRRLSWQP